MNPSAFHGSDIMKGGAGVDTADYSKRDANLTLGVGTKADDGEAGEGDNVNNDIDIVRGGGGTDSINGSASNNILFGGGGNDSLNSFGGNNALFGNAGNDLLDGGSGNDYLDGGDGNDILVGGTGGDQLKGFNGNDTFFAKDGSTDTVDGALGTDK